MTNMRDLVVVILWAMFVTAVITVKGQSITEKPACIFPALYNFGDSNSDTGANSAAFPPIPWPSGMTFFHRPAGRASDGRLIVDFIADRVGLPYLNAYLNALEGDFSRGANFASGGSTIQKRNETSFSPFYLDYQIFQYDQFKYRSKDLYSRVNSSCRKSLLPDQKDFSEALYTLDIGQNDIAAAIGAEMSADVFSSSVVPDLISKFSYAVQRLYELGARTFWIHNTGPIGCLPVALRHALNPPPPGYLDQNGCINSSNNMAIEFNKQLKNAIVELRSRFSDAEITYVDMYSAKYGLIGNATSLGWAKPAEICCGFLRDGQIFSCGQKDVEPCSNPEKHVSWDGVHYTEAANHWIVEQILNGSYSDPPVPITHACYKNL